MRRPRPADDTRDTDDGFSNFRVAPHDEVEAKAEIKRLWPGGVHLLTLANISYALFDRSIMGEQPFEDAAGVVVDALAQESICGGVIDDEFQMNNLASTTLTVVVIALVKIRADGSDNFIGNPFCPVGFTLSTARELGGRNGGFILHLELLCAEKQRVPNTELWIQVGDILLYHTARFILEMRNQDIELFALNTKPHLVPFYSKHGFMLAKKRGGCKQLTGRYVTLYDNVMSEGGYSTKVPFTSAELGEVLLLLGLEEEKVFQHGQGYYMIFCADYKDRLALSASRVMALFDTQRRTGLAQHMVDNYVVRINLKLRDQNHVIYMQKLEQMRAK